MSTIRNGTLLDSQVLPEPAWSVPGIIPEGCCILAGQPRIGKSFLVLAIELAAATGDRVLGVQVQQRPVLYLALEDGALRLQARARMLLDDEPLPEEFYYLTRESPHSAMDDAQEWVEIHKDCKPMVIVDALAKVRGPRGNNLYADDYKAGTSLQVLLALSGSVIAVHHTRKGESDDFLNDVSGTLGLAGSVDTVITLGFPVPHAGNALRVRKSAACRVRWRAGSDKQKRSNVEPVRTRRRRSVCLNVFKLNVCHVMSCGLQGRAIESHSITLVER
jgi:hypothetical protein